jgi:hypothetical protein
MVRKEKKYQQDLVDLIVKLDLKSQKQMKQHLLKYHNLQEAEIPELGAPLGLLVAQIKTIKILKILQIICEEKINR